MTRAEILYRLRYVVAFALIVFASTVALFAGHLGDVAFASLIGGAYLTLCGGGAMNTKAQAPVKAGGASPLPVTPPAGGSEP